MSDRRLLMVTWHDACSAHVGWKPITEMEKQQPPVVRSVGWEIRRTKLYVTLAASIVEDECDSDVTIPLGMIIREKVLKI
jgi:hypothetical protein